MSDLSPLITAQKLFVDNLDFRCLNSEKLKLEESLNRILASDILAPMDMPPYHRAIVEGFIVNQEDTLSATEDEPVKFNIIGHINPGDSEFMPIGKNEAIQVCTGSIVGDGNLCAIRPWEAKCNNKTFTVSRSFPPRFFIEDSGCDWKEGNIVAAAGQQIDAQLIGTIASLGISTIEVTRTPNVCIFSCGDEVIPYTSQIKPGHILDSNSVMLSSAVKAAGAIATPGGIMKDNFDEFKIAVQNALKTSDMIVISGGTAAGGKDFISDLLKEVGEIVIDGVQMKSGRPLIMGKSDNKPIVCVAGHPPEALRGFSLFGVAALNKICGKKTSLPSDA